MKWQWQGRSGRWQWENDDDSKLRAQYNIHGNPNFIIINHEEELIHKLPCRFGCQTKEELIKFGAEAVDLRINRVLGWYGDYGNWQRVKDARREMKKWDIPIVNDFLNKL